MQLKIFDFYVMLLVIDSAVCWKASYATAAIKSCVGPEEREIQSFFATAIN